MGLATTGATIDEIAFGALDSLTGINAIAFDVAVANTITQTGTGAGDDLTISQAGAVDASLILTSAGTSTTDALIITSVTGTIDLNSADNLDIDVADNYTLDTADGSIAISAGGAVNGDITITPTDDFTLDGTNAVSITSSGAAENITIDAEAASVVIDAGEAAADDAIVIETTGAASGMRIISLADIDITTTGTAGEDITLDNQGGSVHIISTEAVDDGFNLDTTGGVDIDTTTSFSVRSAEATGDAIELVTTNAAGGIDITSGTGDVVITSTDDIQLTVATAATDAIVLTNTAGTNVTEDSMAIEIRATAGGINIQSDASIDGDTVAIRVDGGATADIIVHNDAGTGSDSIEVVSDEGGILIDAGADDAITLTAGTGGVVFTSGQTRSVIFTIADVIVDPSVPPGTTDIGTTEQAYYNTLNFDANPNATGDDYCFISWVVPAGYVTDSADLHCYWSHSDAEDAADEIDIDGTVNAVAPGEAIDAAGTAMAAVTSVIADASASAGTLVKTSLDIEVETIAVGDLVMIAFFVDESASLMDASGTADVHYFEITYESTE